MSTTNEVTFNQFPDPNMLTLMQIMEVVRSICGKATEGIQHAGPSAQLCLSIIEVSVDENERSSCGSSYSSGRA